jgi:hypothetical protein
MAEITRAFGDPGRYVIEAELLAEGARSLRFPPASLEITP